MENGRNASFAGGAGIISSAVFFVAFGFAPTPSTLAASPMDIALHNEQHHPGMLRRWQPL